MSNLFQEPNLTDQLVPTPVMLEEVVGTFPRVSSAPTWTPKKFNDSFAFYANGSTYRLYVYDFTNNAWRFCALS